VAVTCEFVEGVLVVHAIGDYSSTELTLAIRASFADPQFGAGLPLLLAARSA